MNDGTTDVNLGVWEAQAAFGEADTDEVYGFLRESLRLGLIEMGSVHDLDAIRTSELALAMGLDQSRVAQILERLHGLGWLDRLDHEEYIQAL